MARHTITITFDAADPAALGAFWCEALGYVFEAPPAGFDSWPDALRAWGVPESDWNSASAIVDPDGSSPRIFIQRVPEHKTAKNRMHLDVITGAGTPAAGKDWSVLRAEAARLVEHGASVVSEFDRGRMGEWIVMRDPEGNEFCVC